MVPKAATIPFPSPPSAIGLVVLELTGEEDGDEDFVDCTLDGDDSNETEHGVGRIPGLEEPL